MPVGLLWASPAPDLSDLLPNRPPWRSAPHVLNLSWTGSCGLWGRPITQAASLVWCAIVASMASLSQWMPPARSTALRTSTGQAGSPTFVSGCLAFPVFLISSSCPSTSLSCFSPLPCLVLINITLFPQIQDHTSGLFCSPSASHLLWALLLVPFKPGA